MARHHVRSSKQGTSAPHDVAGTSPSEDILDAAIEYTFPASDPISVATAYRARERGRSGDNVSPAGRHASSRPGETRRRPPSID
jgi:hypothetical protein